MRLTCPLCGPRDRREFYYQGAAVYLDRPAADALPETWDSYLHLRANPAGVTTDLWYHETGCTSWLKVTRNTVTHEILSVELVAPMLPRTENSLRDTTTASSPRKPSSRKKKPVQ